MKTSKKEYFILIENERESLTEFSSNLTKQHNDFKNSNVVVDLIHYKDIKTSQLLSFLEISNVHKADNKSFILVNDSVGIDDLPDDLVVVPTLQEAEDMIQMDEMQRDLGF